MVPVPQEHIKTKMTETSDADRIVISGMSGAYPQSSNTKEFAEMLYNKADPISNARWVYNHPEVPKYTGEINGLDKFDAQFFKVHRRLGLCMDPISRKLLEHTYQALYDAGVNVEQLAGKNIGVFVGTSFSESEKVLYESEPANPSTVSGFNRGMYAHRISYWLDIKGPSAAFDDVCCSSLVALEQAYLAIQRGDCDAAIVGSGSTNMHPQTYISYGRNINISDDGKTKSFDQNANGCVKSACVNVLFLQRAKHALRIYADVVNIKTGFSPLQNGKTRNKLDIKNWNTEMITDFLETFYRSTDVLPAQIEYVEAFGCATPQVDKAELEAFDKVFCKNRTSPLLVGSVMSNIGYCESASGIASIQKVLLAYHEGTVAANLHCSNPRNDIMALCDDRIRVVTKHEPIGCYAAVNNLSIMGYNGHVLLRRHDKLKDLSRYKSDLPYLVTLSGRHESAVIKVIDDLKSRPIDQEELALLRNIHETRITGHLARGFTILESKNKKETVGLAEDASYFDDVKRPVWFVYSGMGSQWCGMGAQLMRIPVFAAAIERCKNVLAPKGIDIINLITSTDKRTLDNILHSFVGITAVQIGLTDILREMGIVPNRIIGHSMGELGCAYADGCLTAEETILSSYCRGLVSVQVPFIKGAMAAVGLGYQKILELCPPEIEVACHNGPESSTISGPANVMRDFVSKLTAQGIFAKEVPCSNIAYHSRYIANAGPKLLEYLSEVIKTPKRRSERWVSTSVPQDNWSNPNAQLCSAWYHTNNFLSPVLFEETSKLVPENAIVIEIAPHGLLQAVLKRSLPADCVNVALTKRGHPDNVVFLLKAIGKLFIHGCNPKLSVLYPKIEFPVSSGTPFLSHLVEWSHTESWNIPLYSSVSKKLTSICHFVLSIHDDEHSYLQGHVVQGKILYPFSAALVAVWDTLAMVSNVERRQLSVQFQDVHLFAQPPLLNLKQLKLCVDLHKGTGRFEVTHGHSVVANGFIKNIANNDEKFNLPLKETNELEFNYETVYDLLKEKGYYYQGTFQSIRNSNSTFTEAKIAWNNNWVTFVDGMLQLNILNHGHDTISRPSHIHKLIIDLQTHFESNIDSNDCNLLTANLSRILNYTRCGGVMIERIQFYDLPVQLKDSMLLTSLKCIPRFHIDFSECEWGDEYNIPCQNNEAGESGVALRSGRIGDLDSLYWEENSEEFKADILVTISFVGINNNDAKIAAGIIPFKQGEDNLSYGMDFSGTTVSGDRVMGIVRNGAMSTRVAAIPELLWPIPAHWTLEEAATVPLAYACAFYCLGIKAPLYPAMTILVHGAAGAIGQAVISIALAHQCKVFATVSSIRKKNFLLNLYPELEGCIGNSRDASFRYQIMQATNGEGCDIIICNNVTGKLKNITLKCTGLNGITIDTVQTHVDDNYTFGMYYLSRQSSYMMFEFNNIFDNPTDMKNIQAMIGEGIARGYVRPLSRITYNGQDVSRAFGLVAASRHCGRVLLRIQDGVTISQPTIKCSLNSQLIICDKEGLGLHLADRLVSRGARKIHLINSLPSARVHYKIQSWKKLGIDVTTSTEDIVDEESFLKLKEFMNIQYIEGIYVIDLTDRYEYMTSVINNIDFVSRKYCAALKYLAIISPDISVGQAVCLRRAEDHLPALMLQTTTYESNSETRLERSIVYEILNALERGLRSEHLILKIQQERHPELSLLQQIADIADINITGAIYDTITLEELGLDCIKSQIVSNFLQNMHNLYLPVEQVPEVTIQILQDLEDNIREPNIESKSGLAAYLSYIDDEEILATTEYVILPTLDKDAPLDMVDLEKQYLYIVPGIEGNHSRFRLMCERLKLPALVLQPGCDNPRETIQEMAQQYAQILLKKTNLKNNFYIMAYETGILATLELIAILEDKGLVGTVFWIGGTPNEFIASFNEKMQGLDTVEALQDAVLQHITSLILNDVSVHLSLNETSSWEEKRMICINRILKERTHAVQYLESIIEATITRVDEVRRYRLKQRKLQSRIVLIRPESVSTPDEDLQRYSHQPMSVNNLSTPLEHAVKDPRLSAIINQHLSADILQKYEANSHCEVFSLDDEKYSNVAN